MTVLASLLSAALTAGPVTWGPALEDATPTHLSVALRIGNQPALDRLLEAMQDPTSADYHRWLTPAEFGERFGLPPELYERFVAWLGDGGFTVTRYPNRLFLEGTGTAADVRRLLGVQLRWASADGRTFRSYEGVPEIPGELEPHVLRLGGLDTRVRLRHRIPTSNGNALGADGLRLEYDMTALVAGGHAASGLVTAVLGTQEGTQANQGASATAPLIPPSVDAIQTYFSQISKATATYHPIVMSNPSGDFDTSGSNQEYQLDVEMQSVSAPNAQEIDLVLSPASEVFMAGAQYVVNSLSQAVVVSTSLGLCEPEEGQSGGPATPGSEPAVMRQTVQQGVAEGQSWFAASGDTGADDCADSTSGTGNGFNGGNATVDFPGSMPEVVDMGGTMFATNPSGWWDDAGALAAYQAETTCNEGTNGVAGGGGQSEYYVKPIWQKGVGPKASDGVRDVPDLALAAASAVPGIAVYDCGSGQDPFSCAGETADAGTLDVFGGTSAASPLGAGIFALLAGEKGCRLGDVHAALYALGSAQQAGGAQVFHDIDTGNNSYPDPKNVVITGFNAGPGYDLATGWGSLDVAALVAAWPACGASTTGTSGSGSTSGGSASRGSTSGGSTSGGQGTASGSSTGAASSASGSGATTSGGGGSRGGTPPGSGGASTGGGPSGSTGPASKALPSGGCSCGSGGGGDFAVWTALLGLALLAGRRRAVSSGRSAG